MSIVTTEATLNENAGTAFIYATLSHVSAESVIVNLSLSGDALVGTDYSQSAHVIMIPAGQTSSSITLTCIDDLTDEPNESIVVDVSSVVNGIENGVQQVTATIVDDDTAPSVTLSVSPSSLAENGGLATVRAFLSNPSTQDFTVNLAFSGTAVGQITQPAARRS